MAVSPIHVKLPSTYPTVEPYEPVYPYLVVYPQTQLAPADDCLPLRPVSLHSCPPTSSFDEHQPQLLRTEVISGQQPDTLPNPSRSPVLGEAVSPLSSDIPTIDKSENSSTRRKPKRSHLDLHLAVFGIHSGIHSIPALPSESLHRYTRQKPKRTHHELHLLVFGNLSQIDSQDMDDHLLELPSRSPAPTPAARRQRSRSGTVSSRPSTPTLRPAREQPDPARSASPTSEVAETAHVRLAGLSSRPSVSGKASPPLSNKSSGPSDSSPDRSILSSDTMELPLGRRVPGLPPSPAYSKSLMNRVRTVNSEASSTTAAEPRGLGLSKSLSDANRLGITPRNSVLERARMFTLLGASVVSRGTVIRISRSDRARF